MCKPILSGAPAVPVLSTAEAKAHCRIDGSDDDTLVADLIEAARAHLDGYSGILGRCLVNQSWSVSLSGFPGGDIIRLPLGDAQSVTSITYFDSDGAGQTFGASNYRLHTDAFGPYIRLVDGKNWAGTDTRDDAVTVTWVAGYGPAASNVPQGIRQAMLLLIGHWYEGREAVTVGVAAAVIPLGVQALLAPYRLRQI
jgi:uncharacterized phiE125 gp8 family phage protein